MRGGLRSFACAVIGLALMVGVAGAQGLVPVRRNLVGLTGTLMQPTGEFDRYVGVGGGLGLYFIPGLDVNGIIGMRIDASALWYGHQGYDVWLGPLMPYSYTHITTDNMIFSLGVGPQLTLGTGPVRLYGFGTVGGSYFATISSVDEAYGGWDSHTNYDDLTLALTAGGGLLTRLGRTSPVWLDLSAQWTHHGETEYLREESVVVNPNGSLVVVPVRSEASLWSFRLGVAWGF